ncbi:GspH/FimT family pseudopilin [Rhodoferax ferrireducens]|uniref:GspH/FimT family pseudopilin n=1 Tax=Rhodoferax ferrireducens TaxID=192843 RepID=UPI003BB6C8B0
MPFNHRSKQRLQADPSGRQIGFTLIELLVTIAIATVLMLVAVPSFVEFQRNAQLSDAVSNFIAAANAARANAMKLGLNTYMVPNNTGTGWSSGWMVYADANWNEAYDAATEEVILRHEALSSDVTINTSTGSLADGYLMFNGSGYPRLKVTNAFGGGTIVMSNISRKSSIIINPAGRVRSCKTDSTGCD